MKYLRFIFIIMMFLMLRTSAHGMEEEKELVEEARYSPRPNSAAKAKEERNGSFSGSVPSTFLSVEDQPTADAEEFLVRLKSHVLEGFDKETACALVRDYAPDYSMKPEELAKRYQSLTLINGGGAAHIWKAILNVHILSEGLKVGDSIAIRVVTASQKRPVGIGRHLVGIEAHIRCSLLRSMGQDGGVLTEFFPTLFGLFYGPSVPEVCDSNSSESIEVKAKEPAYQYQEMEFIDTTFASMPRGWKIPDSVAFEFAFGQWAGVTFVGLSISDEKLRNYGLKTVPYGRYYHFGEDHYYFPPGQMPVRLDLESFYEHDLPPTERFGGCALDSGDAETSDGETFLAAFYQRGTEIPDIFILFRRHFGKYRKEFHWVKEHDPNARNYYLDEKWIERERSFPPSFLPVR